MRLTQQETADAVAVRGPCVQHHLLSACVLWVLGETGFVLAVYYNEAGKEV